MMDFLRQIVRPDFIQPHVPEDAGETKDRPEKNDAYQYELEMPLHSQQGTDYGIYPALEGHPISDSL
jgi:hypothetical protein